MVLDVANFPIDKAYLVAGWLASALWGGFTVVMIVWIVNMANHPERKRNIFPIAAIFLMYTLATTHISLVLARLIQAFVVHVNDDGGAILYLANIALPLNRSKDMIYVSLIVLGDTIIVWRCFLVWNRNYYVCVLPFVMIIGTAISGFGAISFYFTPDPFEIVTIHWAIGMLTVSMATNIIVTFLTAGRIWYLSRSLISNAFGPAHDRYHAVVVLILESGLLITIAKTTEFILYELAPNDGLHGLNALYVVMDCMPQIMGICPAFIMLAVSCGLTSGDTSAYVVGSEGVGSMQYASTPGRGLKPIVFSRKPNNSMGADASILAEDADADHSSSDDNERFDGHTKV